MFYLCANMWLSLTVPFTAVTLLSQRPAASPRVRLSPVRAQASFDPFAAPRGPSPDQPSAGRPGPPPIPPPEQDPEELDVRLGARLLGAGLGGLGGNSLMAGLKTTGLATCTPFSLDGCTKQAPTQLSYVPSDASSEFSGPIADFLRKPTSILPQSWKLEGRSYLTNDSASPPMPAAPSPLPEPAPLPLPLPEPAPTTAVAQDGLDAFMTSSAPFGVPPAGAAEPGGAMALLDHAGPSHGLLESSAGFAAVADGGGDVVSSVLSTVAFAAIGALAFEYIATNKQAPVPDPLLSGFWGAVHGAVRFVSLGAGKVLRVAKGALPF